MGEKKAERYARLDVYTLGDLISFYPRSYIDFSRPVKIAETVTDEINTVLVSVYRKQPAQRIRKGMTVYKVYVTDGDDNMCVTIFNSKYLYDRLEEGEEYILHGKVTGNLLRREMNSPMAEKANVCKPFAPVYHQTEGLNSKAISANVQTALAMADFGESDPLPDDILKRYKLCRLPFALNNIHAPKDGDALFEARRRLIFDELLTLQLGLMQLKARNREATQAVISGVSIEGFYKLLPFTLTNAQLRCIDEIACDLKKNVPMNRLVQGDVGSGKTMVAAAAAYLAAKSSYQTAVMAPTEILAQQHYKTFSEVFSGTDVKITLITGSGSKSQKDRALLSAASGESSIVIGTHALIQDGVSFKNLGLIVTDEQHRFGVAQRSALAEKGRNPHMLVMSATPIPRTLALIIYGDLDVSVIDELPAGRQKVKTLIINSSKRERALNFIINEVQNGNQAYIVCPLIEETESDLTDVTGYYQKLSRGVFKSIKTGLLHGRMKADEKDEVMAAFKSGEIKVLISTTVVEVGVDIPNATVMMIENAERYGLSQLHQLRGRVGRSDKKSFCILLSDNRSGDTNSRLKVMAQTSDGFEIAKEDLKLRGPGDFFGERQHGLPRLKIANMAQDAEILVQTQAVAREILADDPGLSGKEHANLKAMTERLFSRSGESAFN